ncbi:methionine aminopeptidase [Heyndrickxia acidicola]|jgi:DnaJ-class molecular chaperone|uniref:Methionine aminopeptidase n=2 Tax=Heyndrickxia acidicola TaxID=209389 RepID=A0ABU6MG60_9BACI|nr:methionine aminopeptidase [Heyndrickxia acidicola]
MAVGLFSTISNWQEQRYEKLKLTMQEQGKCPDCKGRGFMPLYTPYSAPYQCTSCEGSGMYDAWLQNNL